MLWSRPGDDREETRNLVSTDQSQQIGRLLMAASALQLLLFFIGMTRRSYLAVAVPVFAGLAAVSGIAFWVGYTMASAKWDDEDFEDLDEPVGDGPPSDATTPAGPPAGPVVPV